MIKKKYTLHIFATGVLFTLGNTIMINSQFGIINSALTLIIPLLAVLLLKIGKKNKAVLVVTTISIFLFAVYGAITAGIDYVLFLTAQQMPKTNLVLLATIFLVIVIIFAARKTHAIYKYNLFVFAISVAMILLCFIGGIKNLELNFFDANLFDFSFSAKLVLPMAILPFLNVDDNLSVKPTLYGVLAGIMLLFIAVVQSNLTLGTHFNTSYSYYHSVSVISFGSLFIRQDGFIWFVFFVTTLVRAVICTKVIFNIVRTAVCSKDIG